MFVTRILKTNNVLEERNRNGQHQYPKSGNGDN